MIALTRDVQLALAVWTAEVARAKREYYAGPTSEQLKTERHKGLGVGICDRCGIDSEDLRRDKCLACTSYLRRRSLRLQPPRPCPVCEQPHRGASATCGACRQRNYRDRKKRS